MKKGIIVIIVILLGYLGIMYLFIGKDNLNEKNANEILLIHYHTRFKYNNYKWKALNDNDYLEYNGKHYNVYYNQSLFGNYELTFNDKWYLFDQNRNSVSYDFEMFAHHGNKELEFIPFDVKDIDSKDSNNINEALKIIGIDEYYGFIEGQKIIINYDNDYKDETFYIVKNEVNEKVFSMVFIVDNNDIKIIDKDIFDKQKVLLLKNYNFHSIIDIDLDKKYEVIISQSVFGEHIPYCHYMIYEGDGFDVVTSCEER